MLIKDIKKRSLEPELIDLGPAHYSKEEYFECLKQLDRIGTYLGSNKAMLKIFKQLPYTINSILDVGCGGGLFTLQLAKAFNRAKVIGIDINPDAINYARNQKKIYQSNLPLNNLYFELRENPELNEPEKSFDIITASLICHHLSDIQIINFLQKAKLIAKREIIINDLDRHWLSYAGCFFIMPLFFPNRLVKNDSLLSIKKSFTFDDWKYYLDSAGFSEKNYSITWHWPFRWIVRINIT